uniref:piggyBac transposable element-derived protein 4-like n=1 Tax=Osmia lignaria TaxID=473952 RepID=UPI0014786008|nr:piggyBac transposable element-derived protein 4-like [Osmia lignaria]
MTIDITMHDRNVNKTSAIVLSLIQPLLGKGYTLWLDNFYTSPALARFLKEHRTDCVGTLKTNRKNFPVTVKNAKLKKGETIGRHVGSITVMKWYDKRNVCLLSTYHGTETKTEVKHGKEITKPICVYDYNCYMGGVDRKDQLLQPFLVERKKMSKWYIKLFRRLLNVTVLNSMIIYKHNTKRNISQLAFRIALIEQLFVHFQTNERRYNVKLAQDNIVPRLTERHFIRKITPKATKANPQRRCAVCTKHGRKKDTRYCCENCNVGLCLEECFEAYHTQMEY